ncbi:glycosyltransferase involved in cell wall biosynthesis [Arthrobacter woluwensis]|uniref:glycosyltransferase family 2 protein n=1 Tax=Arthrobacter woluwensis TaxID=156980 RepID=UPI0027851C91|nr:glycosyltransferase family 2 protein [Arthrobacter woluwensis]MDQ0707837.1 glycosyltransferase involved in cell wall biosynthesis [Arthrobacter woluwensis]
MTERITNGRRVSAVIPTIGRPELYDAVASALAQTESLHEVIVAADTSDELMLPADPRVTVVRTGPRAGGNVARMAGISAASGDVIALLDDDDVWHPEKLALQLSSLDDSQRHWLSTTTVQEPSGRVWPQRLWHAGERLPHYLFRKTAVKGGQGAMHTSTLVFPRAMVLAHPFDVTLRFHQDTDWLLRLDREIPGLDIRQVVQPLTELRDGGGSVSRGIKPSDSLAWARRALQHLDRRTRGDFLITVTYFQAWRHRDIKTALRVLATAFTWGRPGFKTLPAVAILPLKVLTRRGIA